MTNYNGPDGFTAHCSNCGQLKIRHSFMGSRCPGTFKQGPVVQQEVQMAAEHEAARTAALYEPSTLHGGVWKDAIDECIRIADEDEDRRGWVTAGVRVAHIYDAVAAAKELVAYLDTEHDETCWDCCTPPGHPHSPRCQYVGLRERILAAP